MNKSSPLKPLPPSDQAPSRGNVGIDADEPFNEKRAKHKVTISRLNIAKYVLLGIGILIFVSLVLLLLLCFGADGKREILSNVFSSLFSVAALTIGFIAGSSIDRE